jgi:hypothetical protein
MPAAGTSVAADRHQQRRGSLSERFVGQPPGDRVARRTFATTATTPPLVGVVGLKDAAGEDRAVRFEALTGDDEAELVELAEGGQIRRANAFERSPTAASCTSKSSRTSV